MENSVRAKLIFELDPKRANHLLVFLRLTDIDHALNEWFADPGMGVRADLLDANGKPMNEAPGQRDLALLSEPFALSLPPGSRLDLLISQDWLIDDPAGGYVLDIADRVWFIPKSQANIYTLRVKFPGVFPPPRNPSEWSRKPWTLFDIPDQKIVLTPADE